MASTRLSALVLGALLLASQGCKSETPNESQDIPTKLVAEDFIDQSDNLLWEALIKGSVITFDSTGKQIGIEEGESNNKATVGASTVVSGFNVRPLYVYDADGEISGNQPLCYIGMINGNLSFLTLDKEVVTVLPKQVKLGEWTPSTKIPSEAESEFKVVDFFPSFTNGAGKIYSDVIKISASYADSLVPRSGDEFVQFNDAHLDIFFAKGVGPVEIVVKRYEERLQEAPSPFHKYRRLNVGTASRTNN